MPHPLRPNNPDEELIRIARERSARGLVTFYDLIYGDRGWTFPTHLSPVADALADPRIKNLMLLMGPGSGKSQFISVVYPLWEICHDPTMTVVGISGAEHLITGFVRATMEIIETQPNFRQVFPDITPNKKMGWSSSYFFVQGRGAGVPSPSYAAYGLWSRDLTGQHGRVLLIDDPHTADNTATPQQIEKVVQLYYTTIIGRQDPRGARIIIAGRRWAHNDLYAELTKSNSFVVISLPAWRFDDKKDRRLYCDVYVPPKLDCVFSERAKAHGWLKAYYDISDGDRRGNFFWPHNDAKKDESWQVRLSNPALFEAIYQCNPTLMENPLFRESDFSLRHNITFEQAQSLVAERKGIIIQSWDTAISSQQNADHSAVTTALVVPCQAVHPTEEKEGLRSPRYHHDIYILDVTRHRWDFRDLVKNVRYFYRKFKPSVVLIERKAAGDPVIDMLKDEIPFHGVSDSGKSKTARIVGLGKGASAQAWFRLGHVFWPSSAEWLPGLIDEFLSFSPNDSHQEDDRVDSIIYLVNYALELGASGALLVSDTFFTEVARNEQYAKILPPTDGSGVPTDNPLSLDAIKLQAQESQETSTEAVSSLMENFCKTCVFFRKEGNWCTHHNQKTTIFSSCEKHSSKEDMVFQEVQDVTVFDLASIFTSK
jgi:predicted phage terminase large subunit-like protein